MCIIENVMLNINIKTFVPQIFHSNALYFFGSRGINEILTNQNAEYVPYHPEIEH
jgi:hypothetical protein